VVAASNSSFRPKAGPPARFILYLLMIGRQAARSSAGSEDAREPRARPQPRGAEHETDNQQVEKPDERRHRGRRYAIVQPVEDDVAQPVLVEPGFARARFPIVGHGDRDS